MCGNKLNIHREFDLSNLQKTERIMRPFKILVFSIKLSDFSYFSQ